MTERASATMVASAAKINRLSIAALVLAVITLAGFVLAGFAVVAIFAVGAGHVALQQIATRGERGRLLAMVSLVIAYGLGLYALATSIAFWISLGLQSL